MLPQAEIQRYGGKAAILNHIKYQLPDMPIPPYVVKEYGDPLETIVADFQSMQKPVIVRSSSPHEYGDFEGIFDSVGDVEDKMFLESAIRQVERSATSERAREYAEQNGFSIDEKMHVIIQEQSPSYYCGAMMRHPNNPDLIYIVLGAGKMEYNRVVFDTRTNTQVYNRAIFSLEMPLGDARFLVDKYIELESLSELSDGKVMYVEFGFEPFFLYQDRPFKAIETADFDLPDMEEDRKNVLTTDLAFGITPPEGIVLPVLRSFGSTEAGSVMLDSPALMGTSNDKESNIYFGAHEGQLLHDMMTAGNMKMMREVGSIDYLNNSIRDHNLRTDAALGDSYCLMTSSAHRDGYDVDLSVPGMNSLIIGGMNEFLIHGLMRLIKKAEVTMAFSYTRLFMSEFFRSTKSIEDRVRIISNGKGAVALRE